MILGVLATGFPRIVADINSNDGEFLEWRWTKEKATLAYCKQHLPDFAVKVRAKEYFTPITFAARTTAV